MEPIKISVAGALATVTQKPVLTSGTVGLNVEFTFDEAWTGLKKTAVFRCGNRPIPPVLCEENRAQVPWEALEKPGCTLFVGVYGTDSEGIDLPTVWAEVDRVREGATVPDVDPSEPTPNAYEQLLAAANQAAADAESVRQDADNGKFKGDQGEQGPKGDKGDAGVIDFIVVTELPADGDGSKIYLVPNPTGEDNNFDEYIFQNGLWEKIGSAGVEVNLDDYVKNTDFVGYKKAGVVKVDSAYGIYATADGTLYAVSPSEQQIDSRSGYGGIGANRLDYAVKSGLTKNALEWTDEEKAAARELLGTIEAKTSDRTSVYAVNSSGEQILVGTCINAANSGMMPIYSGNGNITVRTPTADTHAANKAYVDGLIANIESNIFVANPDTTWQEIDNAYSAGKYIFYAVESWGIMNLLPLIQRGSNEEYIFTHLRESKYLYTVKVNKDNARSVGSVYVVDKLDFDALVARVEALEGNK